MSDDDDFMMSADEEDYDFEYEDDDDNEASGEEEMGLENRYYNAKAMKEDDMDAALEEFEKAVAEDTEKTEWGFKAIKQTIKISIAKKDRTKAAQYYDKFLDYVNSGSISRNYTEKSLSTTLERLNCDDTTFMEQIYSKTLKSLENSGSVRLWIKTALRLANAYIEQELIDKADPILKELLTKCDYNDNTRSTYLLEVYALQIQSCTIANDIDRLKELYTKTLSIKTAIPHPRILGVVRECGGKMYMREGQWDLAREDFFESFKNYDEAGSLHRVMVLKYYVLACMLSESKINAFASQETRPYMNNPQINTMVQLVEAFQASDVDAFNQILKTHGAEIMGDRFMRQFLDDVITKIRSRGLVEFVKPYSCVTLDHIANHLAISIEEVKDLLSILILDHHLPGGRIDAVNNILEFDRAYGSTQWHGPSTESTVPLPDRFKSIPGVTTIDSSNRAGVLDSLINSVASLSAV